MAEPTDVPTPASRTPAGSAQPLFFGIPRTQLAVTSGWACVILGIALMFWTLLSFLAYIPLFVVACILGIVAIFQRQVGHGVALLIVSVAVPVVLFLTLGLVRTHRIVTRDRATTSIAAPHVAAPRIAAAAAPRRFRSANA